MEDTTCSGRLLRSTSSGDHPSRDLNSQVIINASAEVQAAYARVRNVPQSLREIRELVLELGYNSILDACLEDIRVLASTNQDCVIRQLALDTTFDNLARQFRDA